MAQTSVSHSPSYEQKARFARYSSGMPEQQRRIRQVDSAMRSSQTDLKQGMSRLELMRDNYAKKLLREKEQRLNEIKNQSKERNLRSGGTVREFFAERRAMQASAKANKNSSPLPPIDLHFRQMKEQRQRELSSSDSLNRTYTFQNPSTTLRSVATHGKNFEVFSPQAQPQLRGVPGRYLPTKKKSTGVDKQNPLPSLHQRQSSTSQLPNKRYETHNNFETIYSTPTIKRKRYIPGQVNKKTASLLNIQTTSDIDFYDDDDDNFEPEELFPPNLSRVKALRHKRLSQQKLSKNTISKETKVTEFEKRQVELDNTKKQRNNKVKKGKSYDSYECGIDSDTNDGLAQQEKELLEMINREKSKLHEIQKQRQEMDEQERVEREQYNKLERENEQYSRCRNVINKVPFDNYNDSEEDDEHFITSFTTSKLKQKMSLKQKQKQEEPSPETQDSLESSFKGVSGSATNYYEQKAKEASKEQDANLHLSPCPVCGRKFATERLSKHEKVCRKTSVKKRKKLNEL